MEKITTILFDLDGTLLDTRDSIYQGVSHGLKTFGYEIPSAESIYKHVGKEFNEMLGAITGEQGDFNEIRNVIRDFHISNIHLVKTFPNVKEVLKILHERGYKLGAVSNARRAGVIQRLEHVGLLNLFGTVVAVDDVKNPKPNKEHVLAALENLGSSIEEAIIVGDSHVDIQAGKNASIKTVRATYGFHTQEMDNPKPDFFIDDIGQLLKLF